MEYVQTLEPGEFTLADLDVLPDDGMQYELVDGILLVTPLPTPLHQRATLKFAITLEAGCPGDLEVFVAPLDFRPTSQRSLQPDVLVCRREDVGPRAIERPLLPRRPQWAEHPAERVPLPERLTSSPSMRRTRTQWRCRTPPRWRRRVGGGGSFDSTSALVGVRARSCGGMPR